MMYHELVGMKKLREESEPDMVVAVIVDTYESDPYPVLRHVFYGKTEKEARGYMESHKKTDKFFKDCFAGKMGDIKCRNTKVTVKKVKLSELKKANK